MFSRGLSTPLFWKYAVVAWMTSITVFMGPPLVSVPPGLRNSMGESGR